MDIVSTNMTNTTPTNITSTISLNVSTNFDGKKVRYKVDCSILHTVLFVITIHNHYYLFSLCKM